jgi:hypothetical protein
MWFKVDDKFHDHEKVQLLLERGHLEALGLWVVAGSWSGDQLSDGRVSAFVLGRWSPNWRELADQLVDAKLWAVVEKDGREQHEFHDWLLYNDSRAKILADRAYEKRRVALMRDVELTTAIKVRDKNRCRYCGCQVRWGDQRSAQGATYDHVKPDGPNTIDNVVIACRGCNGKKKGLTLAEAGMRKLKPGSMGAPPDETATGRTQYDPNTAAGQAGPRSGSGRVGSGPQNALSTDETGSDATAPVADPDAATDPETKPETDEDGAR